MNDEYANGEDKKYSMDKSEKSKIMSAIEMLKPFADKEGCSVSDLVSKYEGGDEESEEEESDGGKVSLIVARMKNKMGGEEA